MIRVKINVLLVHRNKRIVIIPFDHRATWRAVGSASDLVRTSLRRFVSSVALASLVCLQASYTDF